LTCPNKLPTHQSSFLTKEKPPNGQIKMMIGYGSPAIILQLFRINLILELVSHMSIINAMIAQGQHLKLVLLLGFVKFPEGLADYLVDLTAQDVVEDGLVLVEGVFLGGLEGLDLGGYLLVVFLVE
jgi:hypothetical protein